MSIDGVSLDRVTGMSTNCCGDYRSAGTLDDPGKTESQQHEGLHMDNTILDELIYEYGINEEQARRYLGAFLFHGDEVLRRIGDLSGGEQSRVAFLQLMLTGANFLVLDEPTNHLDLPAIEQLEQALDSFDGTILLVTHDRRMLETVRLTRRWHVEDGQVLEVAP